MIDVFEENNLRAVFGTLIDSRVLKTRPERTLLVSMDSAFGKQLIKLGGGDQPDASHNPIPVVVLHVEDFNRLIGKNEG